MRHQLFSIFLLYATLALGQQASAHGRDSDQWVTGAVVGAVVGGVIAATRPQPAYYYAPPPPRHYHRPHVVYYSQPVYVAPRHHKHRSHGHHRDHGRHNRHGRW